MDCIVWRVVCIHWNEINFDRFIRVWNMKTFHWNKTTTSQEEQDELNSWRAQLTADTPHIQIFTEILDSSLPRTCIEIHLNWNWFKWSWRKRIKFRLVFSSLHPAQNVCCLQHFFSRFALSIYIFQPSRRHFISHQVLDGSFCFGILSALVLASNVSHSLSLSHHIDRIDNIVTLTLSVFCVHSR